jgi:hypothetical protein
MGVFIMLKEIDWSSVELDGIDTRDYPDFCDAYLAYAEFLDGTPLSEDELDEAMLQFTDKIWQLAHERIRL